MAKNDGKIYITISDTRGGKGGPGTNPNISPDGKEKEEKNPLGDYVKHRFFNFIEAQTKQAINYSINNIGNFTGDYVAQQHIQDSMNIINSLINIGTSAFAGFKLSGGSPIGAIVAAGLAVAGQAINYGQQLAVGYAQNELQNRQIAQLRTRAGLNGTNNGSRGTEY